MKYNNKSDIWSLGCVLYEAITLKPPFRAMDMEGLFEKVIKGEFEPINRSYSKDLLDVLELMLNINPDKRPSCDEILSFDFVSKHSSSKTLNSSTSSLLMPIDIPKKISMLSHSLPQADYGGFESVTLQHEENSHKSRIFDKKSQEIKLPGIKIGINTNKKYFDLHKMIERSSDRLKRIREIYLSPSKILLSPQFRRGGKKL